VLVDRDLGESVLQRRQLGAQIAAALHRDSLFGRLSTGAKLSQQELCERFGTSRMPVRDALRELVYSGMVTTDAGRHAVVAPIKSTDVLDSFEIEGMLSGWAVRKATALATEDDLSQLQHLNVLMRDALDSGDAERLPALNWQFHRKINHMARSPTLLAALRLMCVDVPRDYLAEVPDWAPGSLSEHEQIVTAIGERRRHARRASHGRPFHVIGCRPRRIPGAPRRPPRLSPMPGSG
jgi:DNA-binding GntR family transcriptional regulator